MKVIQLDLQLFDNSVTQVIIVSQFLLPNCKVDPVLYKNSYRVKTKCDKALRLEINKIFNSFLLVVDKKRSKNKVIQ
jgi:hypothetical protein